MRFTKRKNPHDIIRAIPKIHALLPRACARCSRSSATGRSARASSARSRGSASATHVELTGFRPRHEIREILARSSLFILPTSKEALSIATLEARCCGLPVVAMNHGGVGDLITQRPRRLPGQHARRVHRAHRRGDGRRRAPQAHERSDQAQPRLVRLGLGHRAAHARVPPGLPGAATASIPSLRIWNTENASAAGERLA